MGTFREIDPLALEDEWVEHSRLHASLSDDGVEAQDVYDKAVAEFDRKAAQLEMDLRDNPGDFGLAKVTESSIKAAVLVQPEYVKAQEKMFAARRANNKAKAALITMEHRKRALSQLVELWVRDYYSDSSASVRKANELTAGQTGQDDHRTARLRGRERRAAARTSDDD